MKKWLYYTTPEGEISSCPYQPKLHGNTNTSRRKFIGNEAERFSVQEAVLNPLWDGSEYIKDPENKEAERQEAKAIRDDALHSLTVELNGNVFQTRPSDEVNFRLSIETMGDSEEWILDDNSVVEVTKAQLIQVYSEGLAKSKAIYQVYKEALKAL